MPGGEPSNGGRVTTRELHQSILAQNEARAQMERRLIARMDDICDSVSRHDERINNNKEEIKSLRRKSDTWNAGNTAGLILAWVLSALGIPHNGG